MRTSVSALFVLLAATSPTPDGQSVARSTDGEAVVIPCRVVAREGERPVAGAEVVVRIGTEQETTRTDADGRFALRIAPDRKSDPLARLSLTVRHPDFITKKGFGPAAADALALQARGEPLFCTTIRLDPGVEYTGQVVRPDGSPAAGLHLEFGNWGWTSYPREAHFSAENETRTDAQGRFRVRMWKTQALQINALPDDLAPLQRFIGHDGPREERPDYFVPADLGKFVLEDGIRTTGRLLDRKGRPIAGERLEIQGRIRRDITRTTTTDANGSFAFGPLRPGSYTVQAQRQGAGGGIDYGLAPLPPPARAIRPLKVVLSAGERPEPIELREVPTVTVTCRFVDSRARPVKGAPVSFGGLVPDATGKANPFEVPGPGIMRASTVNEPEPEDKSTRLGWGVQAVPDAEGKIVFHAPKGLRSARLYTVPPDNATSIKTRLREGAPLKFWGGGQLGDLTEDIPGVTFVYYRAPAIVATVEAEGGRLPDDLQVGEHFIGPSGGSYGGTFGRQDDGRFRSHSLMPDHEYEVTAGARGWLWTKVGCITLPEGGYTEVRLTLRKKPEPLKVGDAAAELDAKDLDGKSLRLADYQGKFVLLDLWPHAGGPNSDDLPFLKAVRAQFRDHPLFVMIGVAANSRRNDAVNAAARQGIDWLRGLVESRDGESPVPSLYGADRGSGVVLIGPDGHILAAGLHGAAIVGAVSKALAP